MTTAANLCFNTSSTGGTGSLVLSSIASPYPINMAQYIDTFGSSGNPPWVDYEIFEFTDSTQLKLVQHEFGVCPLTFSGGVGSLNRAAAGSIIYETYVFGTGYSILGPTTTQPSPVSFGTTAANILITCSPFAGSFYATPYWTNLTNTGTGTTADCVGQMSLHSESISAFNCLPVTNTLLYIPFNVGKSDSYTKLSVVVLGAGSAGDKARGAIYDLDNTAWVGSLRADWVVNGGAEWDLSSTGVKTSTMSSPIYLSAGWYAMAFNASLTGAPSVAGVANGLLNPFGTKQGVNIASASDNIAYGAFASSGITQSAFQFDNTVTNPPSNTPVLILG